MTYRVPPITATLTVALIAGLVQTNVIVGVAGLRYRIVGYTIGINRLATGIVDATLDTPITPIQLVRVPAMQIAGAPGVTQWIPAPGIVGDVGASIRLSATSSLATGSINCLLYYYIDQVS